nr:hypothetical transcript [Hymenolepis microstoma]CUU98996.1 hypothetical transcript [Hymenolepis microstoma]
MQNWRRTILNEDSCQTQEELSKSLDINGQAISQRLKQLGMVGKEGYWVPHGLKPRNVELRLFDCEELLKSQTRKAFLHRIVTGDEKWVHYNNPNPNPRAKKSWGLPGGHTEAPVNTSAEYPCFKGHVLRLVEDQLGVIYYELLKPSV